MPLANSCVLRRHCRRLAFFLPCFACTGPGRCTYTPAPRTRSGPASAGLLRTHLRFWLRRAHRSGASFQGVRIHLQRLQDEAPRLGLAFQPPQPPFPSLLSEPTWRPSGPRAPLSDAGRAAGCGRRTSPAPSTGGPPPRPHAELLGLQTSGPMGPNSQLLARSPGDLPAPGNWRPNPKHRGCSETRGLSSLRQ